MFKKNEPFSYDVDPDFDFILEEKANKFTALRKIKWGSSTEYKLDIRNYVSNDSGEQMLKGCTLISENGAHELTRVFLEQGFGNADEIANTISENRADIMGAICANLDETTRKRYAKEYEENASTYYNLEDVI